MFTTETYRVAVLYWVNDEPVKKVAWTGSWVDWKWQIVK